MPLNDLFYTGIVEIVIQLCNREFERLGDIQFEAGWLLVNIASAEDDVVDYCIQRGMIQAFYEQMKTENIILRDQVKKI